MNWSLFFLAVGLPVAFISYRKLKKNPQDNTVRNLCFLFSGVFICFLYPLFSCVSMSDQAEQFEANLENSEGYVMAQLAQEAVHADLGLRVAVLGIGSPDSPKNSARIDAMRKAGVANVVFIRVFDAPPMGIRAEVYLNALIAAIESAPVRNANVLISRVQFPPECLPYLENDQQLILFGNRPDPELTQKKQLFASSMRNPRISQSEFPKKPEQVFRKAYDTTYY